MLEAKGICLSYGDRSVLKDVSLSLERGESLSLMGLNGSGKSTLLNVLSFLELPNRGSVYVDGVDAYSKKRDRRKVSYVFQNPERMLFSRSVLKEAEYSIRDLKREERLERIHYYMELLSLDERLLDEHPMALSGGERRKVALLSVLVRESDYILFDEPMASLDPLSRESFLALLDRLKGLNRGVLIATHNVDASFMMDRIVVLNQGSVVFNERREDACGKIELFESFSLGLPEAIEICRELDISPTCDREVLKEQILEKYGNGKRD